MQGTFHGRVDNLDGTSRDLSTATISPGPRSADIGDILLMLTQLTSRVTALEERGASRPGAEEIDGHVSAYLSRLGLSEEMLRRLATHLFYTSAPGPAAGSISSGPSRMPHAGASSITGAFQGPWSSSFALSASAGTDAGTLLQIPHTTTSTGSPLTSYPSSSSNEGCIREAAAAGVRSGEDSEDEEDANEEDSQSSQGGESEG